MTKEQEKALFGNALPDECHPVYWKDLTEVVGLYLETDLSIIEMDNLFYLARSQRDVIGALIEWCLYADNFSFWNKDDRHTKIILSAVIQDTWEEVKKAWELPEVEG